MYPGRCSIALCHQPTGVSGGGFWYVYPVPVVEFDLKYFSVLGINFLPGLIFLFP